MRISGKGEVSGNITSIILSRVGPGIDRFFYGEYVEGGLKGPQMPIVKWIWDYGGVSRVFQGGVREFASIYGDLAVYRVSGLRGLVEGRFTFRGIEEYSQLEDGFEVHHEGGVTRLRLSPKPTVERDGEVVVIRADVDGDLRLAIASSGLSDEDYLRYLNAAFMDEGFVEVRRRRWLGELMDGIVGDDLYRYCWYVILTNRCSIPKHPVLKHPFNMPSKYVFRHQWLWDSSFHAIVLSHRDPSMAMEELENLMENQKPDGRIPHEIFLSKTACRSFWGVDDYSPWTTQPPVLAIAIDRVLSTMWNDEFAEKALNTLMKYDLWFRAQRDHDSDSLYSYYSPLESGWDDSPRWDGAIERLKANPQLYEQKYGISGMWKYSMAPVEAVDLNSLIYLQRRVIAKIARRLNRPVIAEQYEAMADETASAVRRLMWDSSTGFFYDLLEEDHSFIRVKTPAAFLTMFAGIATEEQAEELVGHILNPREFWTTFPIPSVAADEPTYDPAGYWRGRSWINMVWFTYHGLRRYGYHREASMLAEKTIRAMTTWGVTCNENYNSTTAEPMGAVDFGWSTLVIDIAYYEGYLRTISR